MQMEKELGVPKPGDLFIGVIDFFAVLVPGIIAAALIVIAVGKTPHADVLFLVLAWQLQGGYSGMYCTGSEASLILLCTIACLNHRIPLILMLRTRTRLRSQRACLWRRKEGDRAAVAQFLIDLERLAYFLFLTRADINDRMSRYANVMDEFEPRPVTAPASQGLGLSDAEARERVLLGDEGYPLITAQNAAAAVERNKQKRGRG